MHDEYLSLQKGMGPHEARLAEYQEERRFQTMYLLHQVAGTKILPKNREHGNTNNIVKS